jgi:hypothetical protein
MTNKEAPTRPSYYVGNIIVPILQFFKEADPFAIPKYKELWTLQIVQAVTDKYVEMTNNLLTTLNKQEQSLKRIGKKATKGTSDKITDVDKIYLQLYLDIEEYAKQLLQLQVNASTLESYQQLSTLVLPGLKVKNELNNNNI